jgi:hypothetical protein
MDMNWFNGCSNENEVKSRYRDLAKQHHPDLGGDTAIMQAVNAAYEAALKGAYRAAGMKDDEINWRWDMDDEVAGKVREIIKYQGVIVELVGRWVWVTGNTRPIKDILKAAGYYFSGQKCAWYFRRKVDGWRRRNAPRKTLEEIKAQFGSSVLRDNKRDKAETERTVSFAAIVA